MKKRLIASVTCLSMLLIMLLGSTLAWFTDSEMTHNTMTVGNVEIKQHEIFDETKKLFPANIVNPDSNGKPVLDGTLDLNGAQFPIWDTSINQEVNKIVYVENTGDDLAYVRTIFAFEMLWNGTAWENPLETKVFLNQNPNQQITFDGTVIYRYIEKDQNNKAQYVYRADSGEAANAAFVVGYTTYADPLQPGQTSAPSLLQFYLDGTRAGSEFFAAVKQEYEIIVLSQAMQVAGFEQPAYTAATALNTAFGEVTAEKTAGWFGTAPYADPNAAAGSAESGTVENWTAGSTGYDVDVYSKRTGEKVASINVPISALEDGDVRNFYATIAESDYVGNFTVGAGMTTEAYDIEVAGLVAGNTEPITVRIYMGEGMDPSTVKVYHYDTEIISSYDPNDGYVTFSADSFSPFTVVYDEDSVYVPPVTEDPKPDGSNPTDLPEAIVVNSIEFENTDLPWGSYGQWSPTEGLDSQLEAAYTFSCKDTLDEAKANPYANWYCDFYVKLNKDLAANQIFLGGNYGSFGWVGFHNGDLTLEANSELPLLGSVTSNPWTYVDVVQSVGTFICGVGDVDDALAGATFTVMLRLTNPEDETEFYNVATIEYTFVETVEVSNETDLQAAMTAGKNVVLQGDIIVSNPLTIPADKEVVLDLNNHSITMVTDAPKSLITNNGKLNIVGEGEIAITFNGTVNNGVAANAISNRGVMAVNGATITNTGISNQIGYAIDNYNGATLVVNSGTISASGSSYYDGIRLFCGSNETVVTVNGGEISTIWAQNPSANKATPVKGTVIVNGGTIGAVYYENYTTVQVKEGLTVNVTTYGAGTAADPVTENGYTVYAFVNP